MTSTSFRWAPGDALVHCWHRKLSDTCASKNIGFEMKSYTCHRFFVYSLRYQDYNMVNLVGEGRNGAVFIAACSDQLVSFPKSLAWDHGKHVRFSTKSASSTMPAKFCTRRGSEGESRYDLRGAECGGVRRSATACG